VGSYQKRIWRALAIHAAGALPAIAVIFVLAHQAPRLPLAVVLVGLTLAGALLLVSSLPWWRRIDEMEREVHTSCWYSGSLVGALAVLLWTMGLSAHTGAHRELALGAGLCFVAQSVVYLIFWAIRSSSLSSRAMAR